ncbi:MAG TPA: cache domain-containing protein, partial [Candidatus Deferrimicrobiaceae bacterium]
MSAFSGFLVDFPERLRKLRPRNTIAVPVVAFLLLITLGIFTAGYYVNKSVFYTVFEEREGNKARNIHLTIESIVSTEVKRISSFAKILKNDTDLVYAVYHYNGTRGDVKPLKAAMDQLYPKMNLPVFLVVDPGGKVLYQAGKKTEPGVPSLPETPAFRRALRGEQVITAGGGPGDTGIWAIVPILGFEKGKPKAILVLGSRIDDPFARKLAQDTGSQVFLATSDRVIADSYDGGDTRTFDPALAQSSLSGQKPVFHVDRKSYRSYTYVPLKIVDNQFCLVIETDISVIQELLARNRAKMAQWGGILLVGIALLGVGFTFHLIWPLKRLHRKAQQVIREYSGPGPESVPRGNEISTLVHANDLMLETIKNHLAERTRAE